MEFSKLDKLLIGNRVNWEVKSIVAQNSLGWVYVDNTDHPETALVFCAGQQGFYFLGREDNPHFHNHIWQTITELLQPRLREIGVDFFEYSGTSLAWDATLETIFSARDYNQSNQYVYLFPDLAQVELPLTTLEPHARVAQITPELVANESIDTSFLEAVLLEWWESLDKFFKLGSGYCIIREQKAVSLCYASFVATIREWALGVDTHPDYRGRGYAKATTTNMLRHCQAAQISPYWDCSETNTGSRRIAEGQGFSQAYSYRVYSFPLNFQAQ